VCGCRKCFGWELAAAFSGSNPRTQSREHLHCKGIANRGSRSDPAEPKMTSSASVDRLQVEPGPCTPHPNSTKKYRPCRRLRTFYHSLIDATASQIESDPAAFDMDHMDLNLPASVKNNPWLKQKFLRRMEIVRHKSLAERNCRVMPWQQPVHAPAMVGFQDGLRLSKACADHSTSEEELPKSFFEPIKVFVGNMYCKEQLLVIETDKVGAQLRVLHGEGYETPATKVTIPRIVDVGMP